MIVFVIENVSTFRDKLLKNFKDKETAIYTFEIKSEKI